MAAPEVTFDFRLIGNVFWQEPEFGLIIYAPCRTPLLYSRPDITLENDIFICTIECSYPLRDIYTLSTVELQYRTANVL